MILLIGQNKQNSLTAKKLELVKSRKKIKILARIYTIDQEQDIA